MPTPKPRGPLASTPVPTTISTPHIVAQTAESELPAAQVLLGLLSPQGQRLGQISSIATWALKGLCHLRQARALRRHPITRAARTPRALTHRAKTKKQGQQEARQ